MMEEYNSENVELVSFDTLQEMLKEGAVYGLIGFSRAGKVLVAGKDVKNMWLIPDNDPEMPLSGMPVLAYTSLPMCCIEDSRHTPPVKVPGGYVCQNLNEPCLPIDRPCTNCKSI